LKTLQSKPENVHVVCSGRNAPQQLIDMADLVTEMRCIKHPYKEQAIPAQKGIEF
jgi:cob(I)alamin adenosyltransferase